MEYSAEVRQRFRAPDRSGDVSSEAVGVLVGTAEDRSLGIWIRFQVQYQAATIQLVRFRAFGCPHTLAMADYLASGLEGRSLGSLGQLDLAKIAEDLDLPREKHGKLLRLEDALLSCYEQALRMEREDD
jgi:NifU-like protein involved in Fe-S cluster formation